MPADRYSMVRCFRTPQDWEFYWFSLTVQRVFFGLKLQSLIHNFRHPKFLKNETAHIRHFWGYNWVLR